MADETSNELNDVLNDAPPSGTTESGKPSATQAIKAKDVDDLIEDARAFVKKSPAVAIGTAAALGFVLVRLIKSGLEADSAPDKA